MTAPAAEKRQKTVKRTSHYMTEFQLFVERVTGKAVTWELTHSPIYKLARNAVVKLCLHIEKG